MDEEQGTEGKNTLQQGSEGESELFTPPELADGVKFSRGDDDDQEGDELLDDLDDDELDDDDDDAIDGDYEHKATAMRTVDDPDPSQPAIKAEPTEENPLDAFFKELPTDEGAVTVMVHRKPDPHNCSFRIPCKTKIHVGNLIWSGETPDELHSNLQQQEGGGLYQFRMRYGKGFGNRLWDKLIADPAELTVREQTMRTMKGDEHRSIPEASHQVAAPLPAQPVEPLDPLAAMKKTFEDANELRALILGGAPAAPATPTMSAEDQIKLKVFDKLSDNPDFGDKLIDYGFGIMKPKEKTETWIDLGKAALKDPKGVTDIVTGVVEALGTVFGSGGEKKEEKPGKHNIELPPGAHWSTSSAVPVDEVKPVEEKPANEASGLFKPPPDEPDAAQPAPDAETQPEADDASVSIPPTGVVWQ